MYTNSVTRLNFLAAIFLSKVVQIFANFLSYFENISFKVKPDVASFAQLLVTIGLTGLERRTNMLPYRDRVKEVHKDKQRKIY